MTAQGFYESRGIGEVDICNSEAWIIIIDSTLLKSDRERWIACQEYCSQEFLNQEYQKYWQGRLALSSSFRIEFPQPRRACITFSAE
jgi:hypothetical protein